MTGLLLGLLIYFIETLPLFVIAQKSGEPNAWMAFVPILNLWLMCTMADMELWFILLFLLPYVNVILLAWLWMRISENTNKPAWLGILMIVPLLNLLVGYYMAFVDTGRFIA